jgi:hypothetical protein
VTTLHLQQIGSPTTVFVTLSREWLDNVATAINLPNDAIWLFFLRTSMLLSNEDMRVHHNDVYDTVINPVNLLHPVAEALLPQARPALFTCVPVFQAGEWSLIAINIDVVASRASIYLFDPVGQHAAILEATRVFMLRLQYGNVVPVVVRVAAPRNNRVNTGVRVVGYLMALADLISEDALQHIATHDFDAYRPTRRQLLQELEEIPQETFFERAYWGVFIGEDGLRYPWPCRRLGVVFANRIVPRPPHRAEFVPVSWIRRAPGDALCHWIAPRDLFSIDSMSLDQARIRYRGIDPRKQGIFTEIEAAYRDAADM